MGLKILHSADWHMGAPFSSFEGEERDCLRRAQLEIPGKIAELCRRENCDLVLLAGDVFDGNPSREVVEAVRRGLADCAAAVFVSPGNHDFCGMGSPWLEEAWPENVTVFTGGLESRFLPALNCRVYGAGYQSMDCEGLLEGFRAAEKGAYQIGVLHGDPVTTRSPYCPITTAQIKQSGLHYLALGHIHKADAFRAGKTLCGWPGCPMGRGWDETGEKGICLVELGKEAAIRFLPLDLPRFYDVEADVSQGMDALERVLPVGRSRDFYRVTLTGETDGICPGKYRDAPHVVFRDRTVPRLDLWADVGSDSFQGVYFGLLQQSEDPRAELAARISRQILQGREVHLP